MRSTITTAGAAVRATSTLTVNHGTEVSTFIKVRENYFKSRRSWNAPRITTSSALTAVLTGRAARVPFAAVITVRTAPSRITVVTAFAASYL